MAPGAEPAALISNSFRRRLKGKERKLQTLAGYRYQRRHHRRRHQAAARLVLPHQAAADGGAETAQCVRRTRRRGFHPQRLHDAARRRRPRHRHPRAGMRRRGDRDLRRRRRRPPLFDDVQHLHDVGQFALQPRADPDAQHHRSLCRAAAIARSISGSDRTTTRGCSARTTSRSSTASSRSACAARLAAAAMSGVNRAKHLVKHNPALFQMAQRLRSAFHR